MRNPAFLLATTLLVMALAPVAHGQQPDHAVATIGVSADADAHAEPAVDARRDPQQAADAPRSGFGQVMSVLTGLLQDAAQREATGRGDGFALDNPAIEISVTPVEGRTSLLGAPAGRRTVPEGRRTTQDRLAGGTPR